jgi:hypothetical protein
VISGGNKDDDNVIESEFLAGATFIDGTTLSWDQLMLEENGNKYGYDASKISLYTIDNSVFSNNENIVKIAIPNTITTIGSDAFFKATNLTSVTFEPNSNLTTIKSFAFQASGITSIECPDKVVTMGSYAFYECPNLETIRLPGISTIGKYACCKCPNLKTVIIPSSVTTLGYAAFADSPNLSTVIFEENSQLTTIGDLAFDDSSSLTTIDIPSTVTTIGIAAFQNSGLVTIKFNNDSRLTTIKENAFNGCKQLASIKIPDTVTTIETVAFRNCNALTECIFTSNSSLTTLGDAAFIACNSLKSLLIPRGVQSFDDQMFDGCYKLSFIDVANGNTAFKSIDGNLYSIDETTLIRYASGKVDSSFIIPSTVTKLAPYVFQGSSNLKQITFNAVITELPKDAFEESGITSVVIPNNITLLRSEAFWGCRNLTSVEIQSNVINIEGYAFSTCESLTTIKFAGTVSEWNAISKGTKWNYNVPATVVICSNGQVSLPTT